MPLDRGRSPLLSMVGETKGPVLLQGLSPAMGAFFADPDRDRALGALEPRSLLAVPLLVRGKLLGAITLVSAASSAAYGPADVRLAERLADRAALAIEKAQLYRAAQRAIQVRDDVLGIVAHDLRNPLGSILLQTARLRRRPPDPERRSSGPADGIERAVTRMDRLIQDLLDVTRMEAGRLSVEQARVSAGQLVADCADAQRPLAAGASLEMKVEVARDLPEVWADHDRLLQVFENLIGNAIKFTQPGGLVVVGAAARDREVLFWVADSGPGIAAADVPQLFDRFWQARKTGRRGAGLGLPIVKGIVEAHGGRIWVESAPGHGSTFFFTLPVAPVSEQWRPQPAL
jgi:signal transduction histidine kinase